MATRPPEKRRIQRIQLDCPITARLGTIPVALVDLSAEGVRIEHSMPLQNGRVVQLEFSYEGQSIQASCLVVRCKLQKSVAGQGAVYNSGMKFTEPKSPAIQVLRNLIADYVTRDLMARKAHSRPS